MLLFFISNLGFAQKKKLIGEQTYWKDVVLPLNHSGLVQYSGEIKASGTSAELFRKASEWVLINTEGPYNKLLSEDTVSSTLVFQRSFNYFFWSTTPTQDEDNKIIVYRAALTFNDGQVDYALNHFQHDHKGQLLDLKEYFKLPEANSQRINQIKSQVLMHVEGFVWKNGEESGFVETLNRVINSN